MAEYPGVRPKGNGIEIRWQVRGQKYSLYIDETPTQTGLKNAARYRKSLIKQTKLGEYIEPGDVENPLFSDVCNRFLHHKSKELKQSTLDDYKKKLECYWSTLSNLYIRDIKLAHLRSADRDIHWKNPKTRRNALSILRGVFNFAVDEDIIEVSPAIKLKSGKWQKPEIDAFSYNEKESILKNLAGKYHLFYLLMFETGARTGELQALQWCDVRGNSLRIERSMYDGKTSGTKTHQARFVLLTDRAKQALNDFTETRFLGEWVFLNHYGNPYGVDSNLSSAFNKARELAGVRYRRPYYCRHSYATHALMAGVNPAFIAKQMGDRVETVLRNYATWISGEDDRKELEKINQTGKTLGKQKEKRT
jgi:integrase